LYELVPRGNNVLALKLTMEGWEKHEQLKKTTSRTAVTANSQSGSPADHRGDVAHTSGGALVTDQKRWDAFISHASEDKDDFVRPLAHALEEKGLKVWFDEFTLRVGDSLRRSIDDGLSRSRFGIVVISPAFLRKDWPQRELDGLVAREIDGVKVILPVWHNITADLVLKYSPTLADRLAVSSSRDLEDVIAQLLRAMEQGSRSMPDSRTLSMQPAHFEAGTTFPELRVGHFFRFHYGNEAVIGFKAAFNYASPTRVALVLTPTKAGPQPGDLLSTDEVQDVVQLSGVRVIPSKRPGSVSLGEGNFYLER
jgi:hypothetical protein